MKFVTLTFDDASLEQLSKESAVENDICARAVELWRKRLAKARIKLKHWLIVEKGEDGGRVHMHGFIWGYGDEDVKTILDKTWGYGITDIGDYMSGAAISYCVGYVTKKYKDDATFRGKVFTSKGVGANYKPKSAEFKGKQTRDFYQSESGHRLKLPLYYKKKLYTDQQRNYLWSKNLDKETTFVNGKAYYTHNARGITDLYRKLKYEQDQFKALSNMELDCNIFSEIKKLKKK